MKEEVSEMIKSAKGFTLIELVMIIVILGILAVVAIPRYVDMQTQARESAEKGVVGGVRAGIMTTFAENRAWPTALDSAENGAASDTNIFFDEVLAHGITDPEWSKADNVYTGPAGNTYTYDNTNGSFN
jgi:prepilin-type N-terminal cleavage/methylation domain-containing protein